MKEVSFDLGHSRFPVRVPEKGDVLRMGKPEILSHPPEAIREALRSPLGTLPLDQLVRRKLRSNPQAEAVIVISDNTRPVPYSGETGILFPIVDVMIKAGLPPPKIRLLVATGTHRAMDDHELREMLDPRIFELGLSVINHDSRNSDDMIKLCRTEYAGDILVNRSYIQSDIKILTGLVESHFMAGVSGGRKSICPGLISESSTFALHSGPILHSPYARDLVLDKNPVHREALRVARAAGCDMIVNVTLDSDFRLTGVFAGDMEAAHQKAFQKLRAYAAIPYQHKYDLVITHTGFVGVNHYQAAKGALVCVPLVEDGGICILGAHHTDKDPIGGKNYKRMLRLLADAGAEKFIQSLLDPSWTFVPEQWEAQMWTRLLAKIPQQNLLYCCLEIPDEDFSWIPGNNARTMVREARNLPQLMNRTIVRAVKMLEDRLDRNPRVAVLPDGPYGIPLSGRSFD
jgi:nickel-dependent lactate racemase